MVAYGVVNEGELFSQQFTVLKQPLNNKENDNGSSFTTGNLIQNQIFKIFTSYRMDFFETFEFNFSSDDSKEIIREKVSATEDMKKFAVACYKIAYSKILIITLKYDLKSSQNFYNQSTIISGSGTYLSFPWIAWDIIDQVRMDKRISWKIDPLGELISNEISRRTNKHEDFKFTLGNRCPKIIPYLDRYGGLCKLLYFITKWKDQHPILDNVNKPSICFLFIKFGLGLLPNPKEFVPFLDEVGFEI